MRLTLIVLFSILLFSCQKDDNLNGNLSKNISFEVSDWILKDENVRNVDFDNEGNVWIGAGNRLLQYNGTSIKTFETESVINDLSVASDGKVWLGTYDKGLCCFHKGEFTYYNEQNAGLPRNYVAEVEVSPSDGKVWFSSCANNLGGLMSFDEQKFELFTPENSPLNQNMISDLNIDKRGVVYIATSGTVGKTVIYQIDGNKWKPLGNEEGMFYWVPSFAVGSSSDVFVVEDFSLSSAIHRENPLYHYKNNDWKKIENYVEVGMLGCIAVDHRNYVWLWGAPWSTRYPLLTVFDGEKWHISKKGAIPDAFVQDIEVDPKNNIWLCTNKGILILNQ